jgi:SAM-dependent methyltransferase
VTDPGYFDDLYAAVDDPWGLSTSAYERRKYALTVASLPAERYRRAFEPGCAIGVLTAQLAQRCDALVAWDGASHAIRQAQQRLREPSVTFAVARVPADWPSGSFDLVLCSELLYFLDADGRAELRRRALLSLEPDGHLMAVHWRHGFDEAPSNGDEVHAELAATSGLESLVHHVEPDFRLDVWRRERR